MMKPWFIPANVRQWKSEKQILLKWNMQIQLGKRTVGIKEQKKCKR